MCNMFFALLNMSFLNWSDKLVPRLVLAFSGQMVAQCCRMIAVLKGEDRFVFLYLACGCAVWHGRCVSLRKLPLPGAAKV